MCLIIISFFLFPCNLTEHLQSQPVALLQPSPPTGFLPMSSTEMFLDKVWWPLFYQSSNPALYLHFPWWANCLWYSQTRFSSWDLICPCLLWFVVFWYFSTEFLEHQVVQRGKNGRCSWEKNHSYSLSFSEPNPNCLIRKSTCTTGACLGATRLV